MYYIYVNVLYVYVCICISICTCAWHHVYVYVWQACIDVLHVPSACLHIFTCIRMYSVMYACMYACVKCVQCAVRTERHMSHSRLPETNTRLSRQHIHGTHKLRKFSRQNGLQCANKLPPTGRLYQTLWWCYPTGSRLCNLETNDSVWEHPCVCSCVIWLHTVTKEVVWYFTIPRKW